MEKALHMFDFFTIFVEVKEIKDILHDEEGEDYEGEEIPDEAGDHVLRHHPRAVPGAKADNAELGTGGEGGREEKARDTLMKQGVRRLNVK